MTPRFNIRNALLRDLPDIQKITQQVYPDSPPWKEEQLRSHQAVFPEGQFVAVDQRTGKIVGYAASLIVLWDQYDMETNWRDFTDAGMFTNHDSEKGRTLYGAEVMVHPRYQGRGIGSLLYRSREALARERKLLRIRAGARLRGYHSFSSSLTPQEYVLQVVRGKIFDPTLSFQLNRGFKVLAVAADYLHHDLESLGNAAVIEWLNPEVATDDDMKHQRESHFY